MSGERETANERSVIEPEIIPPSRAGERRLGEGCSGEGRSGPSGFQGRMPGGIFFDLRNGESASIRIKRIGGFKLVLWITIILAIAIVLILTFASLFVFAAIISACAIAVAALTSWVKKLLR